MQQAEAMKTAWGVDSVDVAITSHRHYDHYGGMDDVLEDFPDLPPIFVPPSVRF